MKNNHLELKNFNFIGLNSETKGDVLYYGKTYVFGKHDGNITQVDENEINIQEEADINGDLTASYSNIFGKITGNIAVSETLNIYSGSVINGSIRAKRLNIHPGAQIIGEIHSIDP